MLADIESRLEASNSLLKDQKECWVQIMTRVNKSDTVVSTKTIDPRRKFNIHGIPTAGGIPLRRLGGQIAIRRSLGMVLIMSLAPEPPILLALRELILADEIP